MKITVLTVCRNAAATIRDTLESVRDQVGVEVEHIVIDGASTDATVPIVREFGVRFVSEPDRGMYDALDKGLAMATGEAVGVLNADDVFESPHSLRHVAECFAEHPGAEAICGDIRFVRRGRTVRYYSARHWRPWMARWGYMVPHPGVYIRLGTYRRLGGYSLDYRISADFELMTRYFVRNRVPLAKYRGSLVRMRPGGMSTSGISANVRLNRENVRALRANGIFSCMPMMLPKYAFKVWGLLDRRGAED